MNCFFVDKNLQKRQENGTENVEIWAIDLDNIFHSDGRSIQSR